MRNRFFRLPLVAATLILLLIPTGRAHATPSGPAPPAPTSPQEAETGTISGTVTLDSNGEPLHAVRILLVELNRTAATDENGVFRFDDVPPGTYRLVAVRESLSTERATVTVAAGDALTQDFVLALSAVHEHVTVTASGEETTEFDAFNSVDVLDSIDIAKNMGPTIADVLENTPGVAKRSFGPGSARPIIRGFDNDRVLIMQDGVRTGDLSSQSGDHGVSLDPASVQRIEVVKGPATLLYGSNAIGGVVNVLTPQQQYGNSPPQELRGQATIDAGTANEQLGGNGNFQWGSGDWMVWFGGGRRGTDEYDTPAGTVPNSETELTNGRVGVGLFGDNAYFSAGYTIEDSRYGVPFAGELHGHHEEEEGHDEDGDELFEEEEFDIDLESRRQALRIETGLQDLDSRIVQGVRAVFNYIDWNHQELEVADGSETVGTRFDNEIWLGRLEVQQQRVGRLTGKVGLWGQSRDYIATGEEALAPPTSQRSFAAFAYEELDFDSFRLMFGGRIETNDYDPEERAEGGHDEEGEGHGEEAPEVRDRSFTGVSASVGVHVPVTERLAVVANGISAYRAPALEELYNFGPHVGNLAFEIGNPDLEAERSNGGELSLRYAAEEIRGEANLFYYGIDRFIFGALTGEIVDGLQEVELLQGDARYVGVDGSVSFPVHRTLTVDLGAGYVSAKLTDTDQPLPRIPPLHARVGLDWTPMDRLSIRPTLRLASEQDDVFRAEEPTDGYAVVDLGASYTLASAKALHIFSLQLYNVGDELYRNHTSFIKELAPEIGRGLKFSYALRIF